MSSNKEDNKNRPKPGGIEKRNESPFIERKIYSVDKSSARISADSNSNSDSKKK